MWLVTISVRLREVREAAGISARELDRLAGLTPNHTSLIEGRAGCELRSGTLEALSEALGISLDWLVRGVGREPAPARLRDAIRRARARADATAGRLGY